MNNFILILLVSLAFGILYSYLVNKLSKRKLLFLPTILGTLWFIYIFTLYTLKQTEGFDNLAIVILAMMVFTVTIGNIVSSLFIIYRNRKKD